MYAPLAFPKSYTHWVRLVLRLSRLAPDAASIYEARNSGTKGGKKEAKRLRAKRYEYQRFLEGSARVGLAQLAGLRRELVDDVVCEVLGDWGCEWGMWCEEYGLGGLRCRVGGRGRRGLGREMVRVCNEVLDECWYAC